MQLARVRLVNISPFEDVIVSFGPDSSAGGETRAMTVLFGGDRTGKTTVLNAIATTRPGFAMPFPPSRRKVEGPSFVACDWQLGQDDVDRPHSLSVSSPSAVFPDEDPQAMAFRRKEQAIFDRRAQEQGGFALLLVSGARWFSRTPNLLTQPERTVGRYDVRAALSLDDATRADLTRETKQILAYAAIGSALERAKSLAIVRAGEAAIIAPAGRLDGLASALRGALDVLLEPFGRVWDGVQPETLEPIFRAREGGSTATFPFEELPRGARHLVAIATLAVRTLFGAYQTPASDAPSAPAPVPDLLSALAPPPTEPPASDPPPAPARKPAIHSLRDREGVVLVDDIELGQDPGFLPSIPALLKKALPGVQWVLATSSPLLVSACPAGELIALRRAESDVEIHEGDQALLH